MSRWTTAPQSLDRSYHRIAETNLGLFPAFVLAPPPEGFIAAIGAKSNRNIYGKLKVRKAAVSEAAASPEARGA
jgi:hypothetical protein